MMTLTSRFHVARTVRHFTIALLFLVFPSFPQYARAQADEVTSDNCTSIELRPGYPGFRGFVPGLFGDGEAACLEEVVRANPWFDPAVEDAANAAAAGKLGLSGDPSIWLWENWLAIEAERGLVPTCYLGAYREMANGTQFMEANVSWNDPRRLAGQPGSTLWVTSLGGGMEITGLERIFPDDYQLRAMAWATSNKLQPNALELQSAAIKYVHRLYTPGEAMAAIYGLVTTQGGYARVPTNACALDQWFVASTTILTMYQTHPAQMASGYYGQFEIYYEQWLTDVYQAGGAQSLREYLYSNWDAF